MNYPVTAETIAAAVREYNADYAGPELDAALAGGVPVLDVAACTVDSLGRKIRVIVTAGIRTTDGKFIGAADPISAVVQRRDGREARAEIAARWARTRFAGVTVPLEARTPGRG